LRAGHAVSTGNKPAAGTSTFGKVHSQRRLMMPAKSKSQQKAAGAALSAKRGETKVKDLQGASRSMYDSMSEDELEELASTKREGKPEHVADS